MTRFFWQDAKGLKADVERHRAKEKELQDRIQELEGKDDPMSIAALRVYRRFLNQLQQSKADVVSKIGKRK
jgi:phytoene/squalene synthetase